MKSVFSDRLSLMRRERELSQRSASADLNISQALLSHYENGAREPKLDFVVKACDYYGVSADYILGRSDVRSDRSIELKSSMGVAVEALERLNKAHDDLLNGLKKTVENRE